MTNSTDVAIIGGGIMGGSIAYHLAKLGVKSTIFERESIGCEASGVATGMISAMSIDSPGPYLDLARASFEKYKTLIPEMEDASGVHTYYGEISWLDLAFTEEDEAANRANMEWRRSLMPKVSWVTDDDLYRIDPRITREARSGLYLEELNQADAYRLTLAYIGAAESLGVEVRYTDVKGLEKNGTRVTGIITDEEVVSCGAVVLAMGAWTSEASDWIDTPVPIRPYKGQMVELQAPGPPARGEHTPRTLLRDIQAQWNDPVRQLRWFSGLRQVGFSRRGGTRPGRSSQGMSGHGGGVNLLGDNGAQARNPG